MSKQQPVNKPTAVILHGGNTLGIKLAETLTSQRSHIILIDEFNRQTKEFINKARKETGVDAYDMSAIPSLTTSLKRVDYVIVLLDQFVQSNPVITSKKFIGETNAVDALCKIALQQGAKFVITTSLDLHRRLVTKQYVHSDSLRDVSAQQPYTTVELQHYCENLIAEYHDQSLLNARITRVGELMGEGIPLNRQTVFLTMIKEAITKPRLTIPGEGLDSTFYVHILDAVYGIIKALFSNKTSGEVYTLAFPDEVTTLNLAYKILEMNPVATEITFGSSDDSIPPTQLYVPAKNITRLGWEPRISFDMALHETMDFCFKEYHVNWKERPEITADYRQNPQEHTSKTTATRSEYLTPFGRFLNTITRPFVKAREISSSISGSIQNTKITKEQWIKYVLFIVIFLGLFVTFIGPTLQTVTGATGAFYFGKKSYDNAASLDTQQSKKDIEKVRYFIELLRDGWNGLRWIKHIPPLEQLYVESSKIVSAADHTATGAYYLTEGAEPYVEYFKNFEPNISFNETAGGGSREYSEELSNMQERVSYFESANIELSLATDLLEDVDQSVFPQSISSLISEVKTMTEGADSALSTLQQFANQTPDLLGVEGRKTYAVIFQNPMELRSTGGWITSIGIIGIERGQIRQLSVKDVYDIDGQIEEIIPPPQSMQNELGVNDWTLSLANWSPDFAVTADAVEYFLSLSDNAVSIDGVIAVDLEYVRNLVDIWESIKVPGEQEEVTSDNLYDKVIQIHREFTPGSTRKPVFLSNLANEILQKALSSPKESWPEIAKETTKALNEKHILVYVNEPTINSVLTQNRWNGSYDTSKNSIFPVEWNWGGNKANFFTDRITDITITISDTETVQHAMTVTYENVSTENRYPEGDYVNFERIYLPYGSKVTRIEGLSRASVTNDTQQGFSIVSGWITVPVASKRSFTISYVLQKDNVTAFPLKEGPDGKISYQLNVIKQPGLDQDPLTLKITFPDGWSPVNTVDYRREINSLISLDKLTEDREYSVTWQR